MSTNFEILTLKGGRWQIDTTMPNRDDAIEHAKELFAEKKFEGVRVIKDIVDPKTNKSKEITIYDSTRTLPTKKDAPKDGGPTKPDTSKPKADVDFKFKKKEPVKKKGNDVWLVMRTGFILLLLLGVAGFVMGGPDMFKELARDFGIRF